jgi:hypothetical protein
VDFTIGLIASTNAFPASMSTPASAYERPFFPSREVSDMARLPCNVPDWPLYCTASTLFPVPGVALPQQFASAREKGFCAGPDHTYMSGNDGK